MKHGNRRSDELPTLAVAPDWHGFPAMGGGGQGEGQQSTKGAQRGWISPLDDARSGGAGKQVKASGLTAEGLEAGCAGVTLFYTTGSAEFLGEPNGDRRFFAVEVESSGLAAEGTDAAASSTTHKAPMDDATGCEPGLGAMAAMFHRLGRNPA